MQKTTKDEALSTERALKLALNSLKELVADPQIDFGPAYEGAKHRQKKAITAIREALANAPEVREQPAQELEEYDAGLLNDFGGGNVEWWWDYIRAELGRAYEHYQSQIAAQPDHIVDANKMVEQPAPATELRKQQEPVATLWQHSETGRTRITMLGDITDCDARWFKAADLYTSPPAGARTEDGCSAASKPWRGLTDEEMRELEKQFNAERVRTSDEEYLIIYPSDYWAWQRAIEAKLREKNEHREKNA